MRCVAREFWRSSGYMYELGTTGRAGRGGVKTEGDDRCVWHDYWTPCDEKV